MSLLADELHDLEMSTDDRQVFVDGTKDLAVTHELRTVEQSLAISAGDVLRPLIGNTIEAKTLGDVEATLEERLRQDPQISSVDRVEVFKINRGSGTISVRIFTGLNNSFEIEVTV